jgi:tetratricopeptide (TPR) repeat protein
MAKRKRKKIKSLKGEDSGAYFKEAVDLLRFRKLDLALKFAEKGKEVAKNDADIETANEIITEAHFRIALNNTDPAKQLDHLENCLKYLPDEPRFRFYKGIALLKQRNSKEALKEFQFVEDKEPDREGLSYFKNIASIDEEKDFDNENLSDKERNTLKIVQQFLAEDPKTEIDELPWNKVLGRYPKIWKALYEMKLDETYAPADTLKKGVNINRTKSISSLLQYYEGLAHFRKNNTEKARIIWQKILRGDFSASWARKNLMILSREELLDLIDEEKWQQAASMAARLPEDLKDSSLSDVISYALFNLGYQGVEKGKWNQGLSYWKQARNFSDNRYLAQNVAIVQEKIEDWDAAAQAWRDVLRRRPRREDHPDYLSDKQVSAVWAHVGECYQKNSDEKEAVYCLRKAIEYAPDNMNLRMELVQYLFATKKLEAAENEINNILEIDPENKQALIQLAQYYETNPSLDASGVWEKLLAIDPDDEDIKNMIAESYVEKAESEKDGGIWGLLFGNSVKDRIKIIKKGLEILPGHPKLLLHLGIYYRESNKNKKAKKFLMEAYNKAPDDTFITSTALHELIHVQSNENELVEKLIPELHKNPKVYISFWINQIAGAAHCNLGEEWIMRFCEEALAHLEHSGDETLETKASTLFQILLALREENEYELFDYYKIMVEEEVPNSGVLELIKAWEYFFVDQDISLAKRMIRKTKKIVEKTNDMGMMRQADRIEQHIDQLSAMLNQYILEKGLEDMYEFF